MESAEEAACGLGGDAVERAYTLGKREMVPLGGSSAGFSGNDVKII